MKALFVLLIFLLNGCYLANGSPSSVNFWIKNNKKISVEDIRNCQRKAYSSIGERSLHLYDKFINDETLTNDERKERSGYIKQATHLVRQCYYDLGYRFKAPLYWCLAQDGDNTRTCTENMQYRN